MSALWILWLGIFLYRYCCSLFTKYLKCRNHWMTVDFILHCANALWVTEWWKRDGNPVQNFNYGATVQLFILPSIRELISSCQKKLLVWSAFSPHLIQQATILKLRKSVWPSVFKYTELFSLEENGCFYNNNWTLMFLMLLSHLDGSGLFLNCAFVLWFLSVSWIE